MPGTVMQCDLDPHRRQGIGISGVPHLDHNAPRQLLLNLWTDPSHSEEDGICYALCSGTLIGTPRDVAEQVAELRDVGVGHLLCQMSFAGGVHARASCAHGRDRAAA